MVGCGNNTNHQQSLNTQEMNQYTMGYSPKVGDKRHWVLTNKTPTKLTVRDNPEALFSQVRCGLHHTLALTQSGQLYAVGQNSFSQCGL
mmetsp:Transcript_9479/g.20760  ORF Transcript_9479/g.20760 Transcript_9479/m.20760 type:complete len:89 (+) Transcript_9479:540-806(+)